MGNDERILNLGKKQNLVERILQKCIFHDFKVNSVLSTFFILSYLSHINKYNEILHLSVTRLHSSVGRALNLRLEDCRFKSSFFHSFFHSKLKFFFKNDGLGFNSHLEHAQGSF